MRLLIDEMPYYKDDCLFAEQKWNSEKKSWVTYCRLTGEKCDLDVNKEECSCLRRSKSEWRDIISGQNDEYYDPYYDPSALE